METGRLGEGDEVVVLGLVERSEEAEFVTDVQHRTSDLALELVEAQDREPQLTWIEFRTHGREYPSLPPPTPPEAPGGISPAGCRTASRCHQRLEPRTMT